MISPPRALNKDCVRELMRCAAGSLWLYFILGRTKFFGALLVSGIQNVFQSIAEKGFS
jgi:hypothetical protein